MRVYIICPFLLILVGCAATKPQASIKLKDPNCKGIVLEQVSGGAFEGSAEMILRSNVPGIWIDAKIVDSGVEILPNQIWNTSLAFCENPPSYKKERTTITLNDAYPDGHEKCLKLSIQLKGGGVKRLSNVKKVPAVALVTVCPPFDL